MQDKVKQDRYTLFYAYCRVMISDFHKSFALNVIHFTMHMLDNEWNHSPYSPKEQFITNVHNRITVVDIYRVYQKGSGCFLSFVKKWPLQKTVMHMATEIFIDLTELHIAVPGIVFQSEKPLQKEKE